MSIRDAMESLENMPMGAVGEGGATMEEIRAAETLGLIVEDDTCYHQAQKAWLFLREVLRETTDVLT